MLQGEEEKKRKRKGREREKGGGKGVEKGIEKDRNWRRIGVGD